VVRRLAISGAREALYIVSSYHPLSVPALGYLQQKCFILWARKADHRVDFGIAYFAG